ncbi:tetratricopeptide repeat protein [bacterium]|nr:tetratricopeptide repeat protein [bacterium]
MIRNAFILAMILTTIGLVAPVSARETPSPAEDSPAVPYGPGSSWIVGHELFQAGDFDAALSYLHVAFQHAPRVIPVALEFQEALQARGFFEDAVGVLSGLVDSYPDSLDFRSRRADLLARMGNIDEALADLRYLRARPGVTEDIVALEASLLSAAGKVEEALSVLREGTKLFPERGDAIYLGMASALAHNGRPQEVPDLLAEGVHRFPASVELRLGLIRSLAAADRHGEALMAAAAADSLYSLPRASGEDATAVPNAADLPGSFRVELADFYVQNGGLDRGRKILVQLDRDGELDLTPSLWLARLFLSDDKGAKGRDLVERIIARWPSSGRAWFLKGRISEKDGDDAASLDDYRQAVDLAPDDPELRLTLVRALMLADPDEGDGHLRATQEDSLPTELCAQVSAAEDLIAPFDYRGQFIVGDGLRRCGEFEMAARHFQIAADDSMLPLNALIQASLCLDAAGLVDQTRLVLEKLRRQYPDNPGIANSLGYFLAEKNIDLEEAERLVQEALVADPSNGAYLDSIAWIRFRQGRMNEAFDYLVRAVNVLPDDPVVLEHLGVVLAAKGQDDEARQMLRRALAMGGDRVRLETLLEGLDDRGESH